MSTASPGSVGLEQFREYRRSGDRALRNRLVEDHLQLADYHVRRFEGRGMATDDLHQVAVLAVLRAVERFDPDRGVSFSTFAGRTIEGELKRLLRDRSWSVRPPRRHQEVYLTVRRAEDDLVQSLGRSPTIAELAEAIGESEDQILEALEAGGARRADSLDQPGPRHATSPTDRLGGPDAAFGRVESTVLVDQLLSSLEPREQQIITMRFYDGLGQPEIAERLGLSQSYVSRLLRRTLGAMREMLEAQSAEVDLEPEDGEPPTS